MYIRRSEEVSGRPLNVLYMLNLRPVSKGLLMYSHSQFVNNNILTRESPVILCCDWFKSRILKKFYIQSVNRNTLTQPVFVCSKLTMETLDNVSNLFKVKQSHQSDVNVVSDVVLPFLLLILNRFHI